MSDKGYGDLKEFICTACGEIVMATKFASQKTIKCPRCKEEGRATNPDIIANIDTKSQRDKRPKSQGDTKELPCINCGTMTTVTKFASASKVLCDECKGNSVDEYNGQDVGRVKVDLSKIDRSRMPTIEDYHTIPSLIANPNLRDISCPACGREHMRILKVLDWSVFGLLINYQCQHCKLLVNISEQCQHLLTTKKASDMYDYSGNDIENLVGAIEQSRLTMTIEYLMGLCEQNNIPLDGIKLPQYRYIEEKPVPVGFSIDPTDRNIGIVEGIIKMLSDNSPDAIPDDMINDIIIQKLKELFKEV